VFEFLKTNYFLVFYGITFVVSTIHYPKYYDTALRYFPILLAYTFLCELLGVLVRDYETFQIIYGQEYSNYNALIYNIFDFIFYLYFFYVFWKTNSNSNSKEFIKYGGVLFVVASIVNPFFQDLRVLPQSYAVLTGSVVLIGSIFSYFFELNMKKVKPKNHRNLLFWISLGLLLFYSVYPFLISNWVWDATTYEEYNLREIHLALIALMYICFLIGFLRMRRMKAIQEEEN